MLGKSRAVQSSRKQISSGEFGVLISSEFGEPLVGDVNVWDGNDYSATQPQQVF